MAFEAPTDERHIAGFQRVPRPPTPYEVFMREEEIPIYRGIGVYDIRDMTLGNWKRLGGRTFFIGRIGGPAELVEMPPEASEDPLLREAVENILKNLPAGEKLPDIDRGKKLTANDGQEIFKAAPVLRILQENLPNIRSNQICVVLKDLGYQAKSWRFGEDVAWAWARS